MVKDRSMSKAISDLKKQLRKGSVEKDGYRIIKSVAEGYVSSVFLAEKDHDSYALKIMFPSWIPRLTYKLCLQEEHAYFDDNAVTFSFWKRKLANRISRALDSDIEVLDANEKSTDFKGFYMPFIKSGPAKTLEEKAYVSEKVTKLKDFFSEIGMPIQSIKSKFSDNIRINNEKVIIIDYESGILTKTSIGLDLDPVNFDSVGNYIIENKPRLSDSLGAEEFAALKDSFEKCKHYARLWHSGEKRVIQRIKSKKELDITLEALSNQGVLSNDEIESMNHHEMTSYILKHLGVHFAIGCTTAAIPIPLPLGWIPRGLWTISNRAYQSLKGDKEKAKVHSLGVLAWSTLIFFPVVNSFGYLLPLKKMNETSALVYGEHIIRTMKGESLCDYLQSKGRLTRGLVKKLIVPKNKEHFY
jgi:hypothetical protein